jgi:two-component system, OmpR family, sensor kinase
MSSRMSLRTKLTLIAAGLSMLGIGLAVGATFGALQDWDSSSYAAKLAAISPDAAQLHVQGYTELSERVARVAVISSVGTVLAIGALSAFAIRRGLRPLDTIAGTAAEIGSGDLTRRVPTANPDTEIGRLGTALNTMLERLESAFRDKESSEARLRRFVADASHELRTPIATIRGYAELFRRGAAERPNHLAEVISRVESEATRMGTLVDELLLLARLDQGRPLEREAVELTALATDAVNDALATQPTRRIGLEHTGPLIITGDPGRLRQALANVLSNVLAHTPVDASATVRLYADGEHAVIEVADTGPGLAEHEQARVFERFYRSERARGRDIGGSGLGLPIVESVATAHGGNATLTSERGHGTTVRITLPRPPEHQRR